MRALLTRTMLAAGGVAAAGMLTATAALAHGAPYTVTAGSAPAGTTVAFTATSGAIKWLDTTTHFTLQCTSARITGTTVTGGSQAGTRIATIDGAATKFTGCTGPAGWTFTYSGVGTWYLDITDSTDGVSTGRLWNVLVHVASNNPNVTCAYDLGYASSTSGFASRGGSTSTVPAGSQAVQFSNDSGLASVSEVPGALGTWNVGGAGTTNYCVTSSTIKQGNLWTVSQAGFALTVSSPAGAGPIAIN